MPIQDHLKRDFYLEMTRLEHWSVQDLRERIQFMLYKRTTISAKPAETLASIALRFVPESVHSPNP